MIRFGRRETGGKRESGAPARPLLLVTLFFAAGSLAGFLVSRHCGSAAEAELRDFLRQTLENRGGGFSPALFAATLLSYFRAPLFAYLLGFSSLGVLLLPLLCGVQGFTAAFSLLSLAGILERERFLLLPLLFAVRFAVLIPCTLLLAGRSLRGAWGLAAYSLGMGREAERQKNSRFLSPLCLFSVLTAAVFAEAWILPLLLRQFVS